MRVTPNRSNLLSAVRSLIPAQGESKGVCDLAKAECQWGREAPWVSLGGDPEGGPGAPDVSARMSLRGAGPQLPCDECLHHLVGAIRQRSLLSHPIVLGALEELELDIAAGRLVARGEFLLELR